MDPRTRFTDHTEVMETLADDIQSRVRTAIPVRLVEDSDGHTVKVQPLIKAVQRSPDGKLQLIDLPPIADVPIHHGGGGGVTVTHPHKKDDEGIFLVSDRSLDAWHSQGGAQPQVDARMHSLSDGFYLSNVRSTPRKLESVSTTSTQIRSDDGKHVVDLHPQDGLSLSSAKAINMSVTENGKTATLKMSGDGIRTTGDHLTHNGNNVSATHTHGGVMRGGDHTDPPDADS